MVICDGVKFLHSFWENILKKSTIVLQIARKNVPKISDLKSTFMDDKIFLNIHVSDSFGKRFL